MEEGVLETQGCANLIWEEITNCARKVAKVVLGKSKGFGPRGIESWWWNKSVQEKIKYKKQCFKALQLGNNMKIWEKCWSIRNETKKIVSEARSKSFQRFYQVLGTNNGE